MVDFKATSAVFIVLTVIFGAATGYLLANPVTVAHTFTTTQLTTSTLTTTSILPAVTSTSVETVTAQAQTVVRTLNFTATSTVTSTMMVTSGFSVNIAYKPGIGFYLTNDSGFTLYFRTADIQSNGTSLCTGVCAQVWPVFYTANLVLPPGLNASAFTTVTRSDGNKQIDYNGWPLYTFARDKAPGDTSGQGVGGIWFAYSLPIPSQLATSTTTTSSATTTSTTTKSSTTSSTTTSTTTTTSTYTYPY